MRLLNGILGAADAADQCFTWIVHEDLVYPIGIPVRFYCSQRSDVLDNSSCVVYDRSPSQEFSQPESNPNQSIFIALCQPSLAADRAGCADTFHGRPIDTSQRCTS